jgi:hypothetical protein
MQFQMQNTVQIPSAKAVSKGRYQQALMANNESAAFHRRHCSLCTSVIIKETTRINDARRISINYIPINTRIAQKAIITEQKRDKRKTHDHIRDDQTEAQHRQNDRGAANQGAD